MINKLISLHFVQQRYEIARRMSNEKSGFGFCRINDDLSGISS